MRELLTNFRSRKANRPQERPNAYIVEFRRVTLGENSYYLPEYALDCPACREVISGRVYEPDTHALVSKLLADRPGDMIHAGTFFGDMLPSFSKACRGTVYAFEPVLENYVLAKLCVESNNIENVALFNAALGDQFAVGCVDVGTVIHQGGCSEMAQSGQKTTVMPVDSLELANLAVLQLDVEGYELPALKGAERTIARCRPIILVEDCKKTCAGFLQSLHYGWTGEVPGLQIWMHMPEKAATR